MSLRDERHLPPLSADAARSLALERRAPDPPNDVREKVWTNIERTFVAAAVVSVAAATAKGVAGTFKLAAWLWWTLAVVAVGGAAAVTAVAVSDPRPSQPRPSQPQIALTEAPPPATQAAEAIAPPAPPLAPQPARVAPPPSAPLRNPPRALGAASRDRDLAAERELLDVARRALAGRDAGAALLALDRHAARFPAGRLGEEREAMMVQALALRGDWAAARARAEAFHARFPSSLLGPVVSSVVQSLPATP